MTYLALSALFVGVCVFFLLRLARKGQIERRRTALGLLLLLLSFAFSLGHEQLRQQQERLAAADALRVAAAYGAEDYAAAARELGQLTADYPRTEAARAAYDAYWDAPIRLAGREHREQNEQRRQALLAEFSRRCREPAARTDYDIAPCFAGAALSADGSVLEVSLRWDFGTSRGDEIAAGRRLGAASLLWFRLMEVLGVDFPTMEIHYLREGTQEEIARWQRKDRNHILYLGTLQMSYEPAMGHWPTSVAERY